MSKSVSSRSISSGGGSIIDDGFNMGGGAGGGSDSGVFAEKIDGIGVGVHCGCGTMVTKTMWAVMMVVAIM